MNEFVSASGTVLTVLGWCARICVVLCIAVFIMKMIHKRKGRLKGESGGTGSALKDKIAKWSNRPWGRYALGYYGWIFLGACVFVFIAAAYAGLTSSKTAAENFQPPVTEENSPVNMFLQLDEDITLDQVLAQAEDRDWYFQETSAGEKLQKKVDAVITGVTIYPAWSKESGRQNDRSYVNYGSSNGEILELYFAVEEDGSSWLVYAYLVIRTDDGTAVCYYYPTDITQWGYKTGFTLTVKQSGHLFQHKYRPDTAQEAIDIAYPLVYPDGY